MIEVGTKVYHVIEIDTWHRCMESVADQVEGDIFDHIWMNLLLSHRSMIYTYTEKSLRKNYVVD